MTPPMSTLLLAYCGDDFTGSTDALEALTLAGVPTVLFFSVPDAAALARFPARFPGVRAVGLASPARGRDPAWMRQHLAPALAALAALGAPVLQYKVCSTFDSSPTNGSIGCAIDLGVPLMPGTWSPTIVGAPRLGRFQAFGHLFAVAQGTGHRLDRHPTMARHPVTPMGESDLRRHLAAQTGRRLALVDFTQLKRGEGDAALQAALQDAPQGGDTPVVFIDVLDDETLLAAGRLVWDHRGAGVFSASSSGLNAALAAHWRAMGLVAPPAPLPAAGPVDRIAVVSGSCAPATAAQIAWAADHGFALHRLSIPGLLADAPAEVARALQAATAALAAGASPLVYTASGPDDPAVLGFADVAASAGLSRATAALRTGQALAQVMAGLLDRVPALRRIAVAGGDSSGEVAAALGVDAVTVAARLAPGAPLCRAASAQPGRDGLELVLKGGQMGGPGFFGLVRDGV